MDELSLIREALKGDLEAFNSLVLTYQDLVYSQAYRLLGEREAAQDATQMAFISAYRKLAGFRGGSFKAWLLRIVTNACYDELRRRTAHPFISLEPVNEAGEQNDYPYWMAVDMVHPEEHVERKELEAAIRHGLAMISPEYREVLILVDMHGLSYMEAARSLGKPVGTVKSRLARGRVLLGAHLKKHRDLLPLAFGLSVAAAA
jgi:RNA polymerase sigma-70 factor (ECF subfamily)